jgi:DNA-binding transcriptional LysR family regulator
MLSINRMRILREIADRGSIAAAAEALYLTPSAVSQHMATLQREAGTRLLEKSGRSVRLTVAGEALVAQTERVLAVLEEAQAELDEIARGVAGRVRTCAFQTAARAVLVPALARLSASTPALTFTMSELEPNDSIPMLKRGEFDVVLTYEFNHLPVPAYPGMERSELLVEPIYIALPATHPLASMQTVRVADLSGEQWIVGHDGTPLLDVQIRVANEAGFQPKVDFRSNDYQVILSAVQAGLGVTMVPPLALFAPYPGVVYRPPEDVDVQRTVCALVRRGSGRSPAIAVVLDTLHSVAAEVQST